MKILESSNVKKIFFAALTLIVSGAFIYYVYFFKPKNSVELYQVISFAKDFEEVQRHVLDGYEDHFNEEDFEYISSGDSRARQVGQFALFEYNDRSYVIMTSPGTARLKILSVTELPEDIRQFFLNLP